MGRPCRACRRRRSSDLVHEKLALVGLAGLENRAPSELSGGQQQRVAVARALIMEPQVLLFDEPLSNLDAKLRRRVREEIRELQLDLNLTVAYVTHDQEEALAVSDRIIVMHDGRIAQAGTPVELYEQPASLFVADFIGDANLVDAELVEERGERALIRLGDLDLDLAAPRRPQGTGEARGALGGRHAASRAPGRSRARRPRHQGVLSRQAPRIHGRYRARIAVRRRSFAGAPDRGGLGCVDHVRRARHDRDAGRRGAPRPIASRYMRFSGGGQRRFVPAGNQAPSARRCLPIRSREIAMSPALPPALPSAPADLLRRDATHASIEDYGIVGDCRTAALISRAGSIDWLCLPDFSSPSVFAAILDRQRGGLFTIRPCGAFTATRRYVDETTPVLETIFQTPRGVVRLIDLMPVVDGAASLQPMREILRIIEGVSGELDLEVCIDPRPNYGRTKPRLQHRGKLGWCYGWSNELLAVRSEFDFTAAGDVLHATARVRAGERVRVGLSYVKGDVGVLSLLGSDADERLARTLRWWQGWAGRCSYDGPYADAVLRSALTLKLLTFSLSGAVIAAPTTSLPEAIGGTRNWDYRYCWLRDAGLTMQAFIGLGFHEEARSFLGWLLHATRLTWPELQVVYDVYGRTRLREEELEHFAGYRGSSPVRIGNGAYSQLQLDVYGEVVFAADAYVEGGGALEPVECRMLAGFGKVVCAKWREPDHGIWEMRDGARQHTFSKLMCWVALDRLLRLDEKGVVPLGAMTAEFRRAAAGDRGNDRAARVQRRDRELHWRAGGQPRGCKSPADAVRRLPACGRPRGSSRPTSGSGSGSGAMACSIGTSADMISSTAARAHSEFAVSGRLISLACRGDISGAKRLFERLCSFANDLGLFGEEVDVESGAALGNFPQAFTHVGLINAAIAIEQAARH